MSIGGVRSVLYAIARLLGDFQAVRRGRIAHRLARRAAGRMAGRVIGKLIGR